MMEHPGVIFRAGPTGRHAGLAAGPDVREIARAVRSGYWAACPDEIDAEVAAADAAEKNAERTRRREQELLAGPG